MIEDQTLYTQSVEVINISRSINVVVGVVLRADIPLVRLDYEGVSRRRTQKARSCRFACKKL